MSETTEQPEGTPVPEPEPQPGTGPSGAPESTPGTGPSGETEEPEQKPQREARGDRRFAELTAKLSAAERVQQAQNDELAFYRRQVQQQAPQEETPEQRYQRERMQLRTEVEQQVRGERFYAEGEAQFPDWKQRCDDLVKMGADGSFSHLLVAMPDGVKVTAALADDPEAVQRLTALPTERQRALALGRYAATLSEAPARAAPATQLTRAPAPIRPVVGRANPQFNEYTADANTLVNRWMNEDINKRSHR